MIRMYSNHAANERTFLSWVRTGLAVVAFGFVVEKFNLFTESMALSTSPGVAQRLQLERLSGPLGRYEGLALMLLGLVVIVVQTVRFARTGRALDDGEPHTDNDIRSELIFSVVLVLLVTAFVAYVMLG